MILKEENKEIRKELNALKKEMSLKRNHVVEPIKIPMNDYDE